ncbi:MAG TPA: imidazole glycerol phosphate synthase subunit HisH [Solirubrobacteraceae bacterium]|jgi:glutamine amidotransferase
MSSVPAARLAVVDYGMGNRRSVQKALEHVGARALITHEHAELHEVDGLVVPGVGAFPMAMRNLQTLGLDDLLRERVGARIPVLGICLGMQLLFERSDELQRTDGLGLIPGEVKPLRSGGLRVPHIGWNEVRFERGSPLTAGLPEGGCPFYHVHSLAPHPRDPEDVIGTSDYGERFTTIAARGDVFGVQFHPEKSSVHGLRLLENFVALCADRGASVQVTGARA